MGSTKSSYKSLIFLFIFLNPLLYKLFRFPSILISLILILVYLLKNTKQKISDKKFTQIFISILLFYNSILLMVSLANVNISSNNNYIYIPEYTTIKQIFLGLIYNNIVFIFLILYLLLIKDIETYNRIEKFIFYFSGFSTIFNFIEVFYEPLHLFLVYKAGYEPNYFFVKRPVSILLNAYYNGFFSAFFTFLSIHYWVKTRNIIYIFLFSIGSIATILVSVRFSIIMLLLTLLIYILFNKSKILIITLFIYMIVIVILIFAFLNKDYIILLTSIITTSDTVGSADLHKYLFIEGLKAYVEHPLGIGIGKMDFGALNTIEASHTESYLLTILLQGGFVSFIIFLLIHMLLIYKLKKYKFYHWFSFSIAILITSAINIQVLQSITTASIVAFIYLPSLVRGYHE